jgi:hypothetical protein
LFWIYFISGQTSDKVLHVVDIPATFAAVAGVSFNGYVDGYNMLKVLNGSIEDHYELPLNINNGGTVASSLLMGDMKYVSGGQVSPRLDCSASKSQFDYLVSSIFLIHQFLISKARFKDFQTIFERKFLPIFLLF